MANKGYRPTRRGFLAGGTATVGAATAGIIIGTQLPESTSPQRQRSSESTAAAQPISFHGGHQAGIANPAPSYATFLTFDLRDGATSRQLETVFRRWTRTGASMTTGDTTADTTLVSRGSKPGTFTMTVGIGGSALDKLRIARPAPLVDLPVFPGDRLDQASSHGDVFVQLCSDDAIFLAGAVRATRQAAQEILHPRWQMNGFRGSDASTTSRNGRNLMGQIDGTNNIAVSRATTGGPVWVDATSPNVDDRRKLHRHPTIPDAPH